MTIVREPNIKNGRPIIEGSKISVLQICEMCENDVSPEQIQMEFENISVSDVMSALEYADKNPEEMEKLCEKRAEAKEKLLEIGEVYQLEEDDKHDKVIRTLEKGTEGFMSVLDRLDGVSRENDFERIDLSEDED